MSADPFSQKNRTDAAASQKKAAQEALARHKAGLQQKVAEAQKPKFNDLPKFKPNWSFK